MRPRSLRRPTAALALLLLAPVALAQPIFAHAAFAQAAGLQASTETLPPAAVQMPTRPVPPSLPNAVAPSTAAPAAPDQRQPGQHAMPHGDGGLLRDLLGQTVAARPAIPKLPGNDAFGAIQEVLAILEADPKTDWGRVDLDALRAHLIDMNEVMLNADAKVEAVAGGIHVAVTGQGRTLAAIRRMVPAHAREIDGHDGWHVTAEDEPDGVILTVTAKDARQTAKIRGLGFSGVMATGAHHALHHLAIARGEADMHDEGAPGDRPGVPRRSKTP